MKANVSEFSEQCSFIISYSTTFQNKSKISKAKLLRWFYLLGEMARKTDLRLAQFLKRLGFL